jgi:copper homeostasis protein
MRGKAIVEVCIDSVESAVATQAGGAARVELCAALDEGGLTPSAGMIELVRKKISIGLQVMIRPRPGDFLYSGLEFETMMRDIAAAKRLGANGVVIGVLNRDQTVDVSRTKKLVELARPLSVTFHRAFDEVRDQFAALEDIVALGIDRILTSGGMPSISDGVLTVKKLVESAGDRVAVMAGSGITMRNAGEIVARTGVKEVHVRSAVTRARPAGEGKSSQHGLPPPVVDAASVRELVAILR